MARRLNLITWDGRTQHMAQWARELGIHERALAARLANGWPLDRALTKTVRHRQRHIIDGRTIADWARDLGCEPQVIFKRLSYGWDPHRAVTQPTTTQVRAQKKQERLRLLGEHCGCAMMANDSVRWCVRCGRSWRVA